MFAGYNPYGCTGRRGRFRKGPFVMAWDVDWSGLGEAMGRAQRRFDAAELQLVLLRLIADEPRHGYELIKAIEDRTGGAYSPSPGVVYPTLSLLEEMGLLEAAETSGKRKAFAVTGEGLNHLAERAERVAELMARLDAMGAERSRGERASIRRAMGNLAQVLAMKRASGAFDDETVHAVVELLDETARKIERL